MPDNGTNIGIARDSMKFNPNLMGERIRATERMLIGYVFIKYSSSDDFVITLNYRRSGKNSEVETLSYDVLASENFLKQKLPPNITVTEWWLSISGSISTEFESDSNGVIWDIVKVGMG